MTSTPKQASSPVSNGRSLLHDATLFELSPEHVDEGVRIGFLHEDKAAALGRTMAAFGQRDPIKVMAQPGNAEQPWRLVTGRHRLVGARIEGITIWAIEVAGTPDELADLEASENLHRRPLGPIERAMFVHSLCQAAQQRLAREHGNLKQQQLAVKARWAKVKSGEIRREQALKDETDDTVDNMSTVYGWKESAAEALELDGKAIQRATRICRMLVEPFPELIEALSRHPVVGENGKQLREIADIGDEAQRRAAIEALLADPELSADEARVMAGLPRRGPDATPVHYQKHFNAIQGGWQRLGLAEKRIFLPTLARMLTSDMKRELRDLLDEELG